MGVVEHLVGQALLNDAAALHDHQPIGEQPNDGKVMGDDDDSDTEFADKSV